MGARLENLTACSLLKALHDLEDTRGLDTALHFLRTKEGKELDFLITIDYQVTHLIEVKSSDDDIAKGFYHFLPFFPSAQCLQLVRTLKREKTYPNGVEVRGLIPWLAKCELF